jgi:sulfatase modifying factor 1
VRRIATLLVTGMALAGVAAGAEPDAASIAGGEWRSILPTGTKERSVRVESFVFDRTPVTNAQFLAFVRQNARWQQGNVPATLADSGYLKQWRGPAELGSTAQPDQPVTGVSWFAARAYCETRGARLPYWYEWELAAAADETTRDARNTPGWQQRLLTWYSKPSNRPLAPVGAEPANFHGVHDLHNLVWEWVEDFNALMISGDSRERGDPDELKFCGSGAMSLQNPDEYAVAMRIAMLSSLQASSTTMNLGFRCATDGASQPQ